MAQQSYCLVWTTVATLCSEEWLQEALEGTMQAALAAMHAKSMEPGFVLGQVLAVDGVVLATVAQNGSCKVAATQVSS